MKIAVCGKGGCGKSTTSALLAREFAERGKKVLIVDSDESNFGLHKQLGVELPRDFTEYFGGKNKVLKNMLQNELMQKMNIKAFSHKFFDGAWHLSDIPEEYYAEKDGVMLVSAGKINEPNEGCSCPMNTVVEHFIENLELGKDEVAIMDMEAGVEHFGRGVDNSADVILMIVEPSFESLRLSKKVMDMAAEINKPVLFALNKVTEASRETMLSHVADASKVAAVIPARDEVAVKGLMGEALTERYPEISALADKLEEVV